jgi:anti-sigma regulatory factor (Ser/Thr protein kinase)
VPYMRCPRCGATQYYGLRTAGRNTCPRCFEPVDEGTRESRMSVSRRLEPEPEAAMDSRQAVVEAFSGHLPEELVARTALVTTELVTNSVKHADSNGHPIALFATAQSELVRIEVTDGGEGFDADADAPRPPGESGWGLLLVDQLAERWGVETGHSFRVWAELRAEGSA